MPNGRPRRPPPPPRMLALPTNVDTVSTPEQTEEALRKGARRALDQLLAMMGTMDPTRMADVASPAEAARLVGFAALVADRTEGDNDAP